MSKKVYDNETLVRFSYRTNQHFTAELHAFQAPAGSELCTWCGQTKGGGTTWQYQRTAIKLQSIHFDIKFELPTGMQPAHTAPRRRNFTGILFDGTSVDVHFAQELSGEDQPAFSGFFMKCGDGYEQVMIVGWLKKI